MLVTRQNGREYRGIHPNSIAMVAREPPKVSRQKIAADERQKEEFMAMAQQDELQLQRMLIKDKWVETTDKKIDATNLRMKMQQLMKQNHAQLNVRRQKLNDLLTYEEECFRREIPNMVETALEKEARMRSQLKTMKDKQEAERLAFVQQKLEQQFRENCDEYRSGLSKHSLHQVTADRSQQVLERQAAVHQQQQEEAAFAEMWKLDAERKMEADKKEAEKRLQANKERVGILRKQVEELETRKIRDKLIMEEEAKLIQENEELQKLETLRACEEKRRRAAEAKELYRESVQRRRQRQEEEMRQQMSFDLELMQQLAMEEQERAEKELQRRKNVHSETMLYQEYIRQMREAEKVRQAEFEKFYEGEQDRMWEQRMAKWRAERIKREQLLQKVLEERKVQIAKRIEANEANKITMLAEMAEFQQQQQANQQLEAEKRQQQKLQLQEYQADLVEQMSLQSLQQQQLAEEEQRLLRMQEEAEAEYKAKVEALLRTLPAQRLHPIRRMPPPKN